MSQTQNTHHIIKSLQIQRRYLQDPLQTHTTHFPKSPKKHIKKPPKEKKFFSLLEKLAITRRESINLWGLMRQKILSISQDSSFAEETNMQHWPQSPLTKNTKQKLQPNYNPSPA